MANSENLTNLRREMDQKDNAILMAIRDRFRIVQKIGAYKKKNNLPIKALKVEQEKFKKIFQKADQLELDRTMIQAVFKCLIRQSKKIQASVVVTISPRKK